MMRRVGTTRRPRPRAGVLPGDGAVCLHRVERVRVSAVHQAPRVSLGGHFQRHARDGRLAVARAAVCGAVAASARPHAGRAGGPRPGRIRCRRCRPEHAGSGHPVAARRHQERRCRSRSVAADCVACAGGPSGGLVVPPRTVRRLGRNRATTAGGPGVHGVHGRRGAAHGWIRGACVRVDRPDIRTGPAVGGACARCRRVAARAPAGLLRCVHCRCRGVAPRRAVDTSPVPAAARRSGPPRRGAVLPLRRRLGWVEQRSGDDRGARHGRSDRIGVGRHAAQGPRRRRAASDERPGCPGRAARGRFRNSLRRSAGSRAAARLGWPGCWPRQWTGISPCSSRAWQSCGPSRSCSSIEPRRCAMCHPSR